jgi:hypothetical protein
MDTFVQGGTICRAQNGGCDIAEACTGSGAQCPNDAFQPSGTVCRAQNGTCDIAETCPGGTGACPNDAVEPNTTVCRRAVGPCDAEENCNGTAKTCPADAVLAANTVCKARSNDACDLDDVCTGGTNCPVRAAQAGTVCRAAANVCDVQETCSGTSETCPTNTFAGTGTQCTGVLNYTGPSTRNAANCLGANTCPINSFLNCIDIDLCSATAATCSVCSCFCETIL